MKIRSQLSWTLKDYLVANEEPPACALKGITEGEAMSSNEVKEYLRDNIQFLMVFLEEYPDKFEKQFSYFKADLEYLFSLGKITAEEKNYFLKKDNYYFGKK